MDIPYQFDLKADELLPFLNFLYCFTVCITITSISVIWHLLWWQEHMEDTFKQIAALQEHTGLYRKSIGIRMSSPYYWATSSNPRSTRSPKKPMRPLSEMRCPEVLPTCARFEVYHRGFLLSSIPLWSQTMKIINRQWYCHTASTGQAIAVGKEGARKRAFQTDKAEGKCSSRARRWRAASQNCHLM